MNTNNVKLLYSLIKNIRSKQMNRAMIGYSIEEKLAPVTLSDVAAFAEATRDKNEIYYKETGSVPPFFISRLVMPPLRKILTHKNLNLNFLRLVHSGQDITWHKEIHTGDELSLKLIVSDICDNPAGELLAISASIYTGNLPAVDGMINIIIRGPGKRNRQGVKKEKHKEIFRVKIPTYEGQQVEYAKISGDNNFIHTSNFIAKAAGLPRTIMHGACVMAMTCNALADLLLKNDIKRLKAMSVRFAYPAIPGETLELVGYKGASRNETTFSVLNSSAREVLKNGMFRYK